MPPSYVLIIAAAVAVLVVAGVTFARQFKRWPGDRVLVVYGAGLPGSAVVDDSGARFVWPVFQDCAYLSLAPIALTGGDGPRAVRVGDTPEARLAAAEQFLGMSEDEIAAKVRDELARSDAAGRPVAGRLAELGLVAA